MQSTSGALRAICVQAFPAMHCLQSVSSSWPSKGLKEPAGQGIGSLVPSGQ